MKYEYMKEYQCNGVKPDLPDDVLVQVWSWGSNKWHDPSFVGERRWATWNKFRIVDDRYKPESDSIEYFRENYQWDYHDDGSCTLTPKSRKPKSDWFERGELPPVGEKVEYPTGKGVVVIDSTDAQGAIIIVDDFDGSYHRVFKSRVKPLRTERDELIDKYTDKIMRDGNCNGDEMFTVEEAVALMYDNNWRPVEK